MASQTFLYVAAISLACLMTVSADCDILTLEKLEGLIHDTFPLEFYPRKHFDGSYYCATDTPIASLPLGLVPGIPVRLSGPAQCAFYCQNKDGCIAFNYVFTPLSDGTQCQLFSSFALKFNKQTAKNTCRYYEVPGNPLQKTDVSAFSYDPVGRVYFLASSVKKSWNDAAKDCASYGPNSHLPIFRSNSDYDAFVKYVKASGTSQACGTTEWNGYWLALRRKNLNCKEGWIWDIKNSPTGAGAIDQTDNGWNPNWSASQPDCSGNTEMYGVSMINKSYATNDNPNDYVNCFVCQVFG